MGSNPTVSADKKAAYGQLFLLDAKPANKCILIDGVKTQESICLFIKNLEEYFDVFFPNDCKSFRNVL